MMWDKVYGENGLLEALTAPQRTAARSKENFDNLVFLRRKN